MANQSKKLNSSQSKRAAQLLKELREARQQSQQSRQRQIENWNQSAPGPKTETFPGTITGYRFWKTLVNGPQDVLLHPVGMAQMNSWQPGWNQAVCARLSSTYESLTSPGHIAPDQECGCGFWAFYDLQVFAFNAFTVPIAGVIEGAGRVQLHTDGFRAEGARVKALFLHPILDTWSASQRSLLWHAIERMANIYDVPVLTSHAQAQLKFPPTNPADFGIEPEDFTVVNLWGSPTISGFSTMSQIVKVRRLPNG